MQESVTGRQHTLHMVGSYNADDKEVFAQRCALGTD